MIKLIFNTRKPVFFVLHLLLLATAIFLLYSNTLESPLTYDDIPNIVLNNAVHIDDLSLQNLKKAAIQSPNYRRWLPNISFGINYYFNGLDVFGFHLVNIFIHIAVAFSFYLLARFTLNLPSMAGCFPRSTEVAFVAALLWAIHPLQTNCVTYIVQRMTSMAAFFSIWSLLCYAYARISSSLMTKVTLFGTSCLAGILALLSKENSGMLPVIMFGYDFFFLQGGRLRERKKKYILAGVLILVFIAICCFFLGSSPVDHIIASFGSRRFTLGQRLLTETRVVFHYLSLLILPLPSRLNIIYDYPLSTGILAPPQTLVALLGIAGLVILCFFLIKRDRLASFAIFWFLGNLVIESSIIPLNLVFEYRMYVPSMFLVLVVVAWSYRLGAMHINYSRLGLVVIIIIFSFFTWQRNMAWHSEVSLWTDVINKEPMSMMANSSLGFAYARAKQYTEAEKYLLKAAKIGDNNTSANYGERHMKSLAKTHHALGQIYWMKGNYSKALDETLWSLEIDPYPPKPYVTLGKIYSDIGEYQSAYESFSKAIKLGLATVDLYIDCAASSFQLGNVDESIRLLSFALNHLDQNNPELHYNLGIAYSKKGMIVEAQQEMLKAMQLRQRK